MNIVIVGAGGTASHLWHPLLAYLSGMNATVHIWDADKVEEKNLDRQLFFPYEIGQPKASALARRIADLPILVYEEFVGEDNVDQAITEEDTVFICADNMPVRRLINERAKTLNNVTIINGGNEKDTASVQVFLRRDGHSITPPLDFMSPEFDPKNDEVDMSKLSCAEIARLPGGAQTVAANNTSANLMLQAYARVNQNVYGEPKQWTKVTVNIPTGTIQTSDVRLLGGLDD